MLHWMPATTLQSEGEGWVGWVSCGTAMRITATKLQHLAMERDRGVRTVDIIGDVDEDTTYRTKVGFEFNLIQYYLGLLPAPPLSRPGRPGFRGFNSDVPLMQPVYRDKAL
jgi:hypothetical protein